MTEPVARSRMLIRRPVTEVYESFVRPDRLTQFWLSKASAPLEVGATVHWEFMVPGASVETKVEALERNARIEIRWSDGTTVRWAFEDRGDSTTIVDVEHRGFEGAADEKVATAVEATQGFTIVLCDLKTLLETGTPHNITRDKAQLIEEHAKK